MGLLSTMKTVCHKLAGVAKNTTLLANGAIMAGASAFAEGADYAIVTKDQSGAISFAPEKRTDIISPSARNSPRPLSKPDILSPAPVMKSCLPLNKTSFISFSEKADTSFTSLAEIAFLSLISIFCISHPE